VVVYPAGMASLPEPAYSPDARRSAPRSRGPRR